MPEMVLLAVSAYASKDAFNDAFDMFVTLPNWARSSEKRTKAFVHTHLQNRKELSNKVMTWTKKLIHCRLASNNTILFKYLTDLAKDNRADLIRQLYSYILAECKSYNGCFRIEPPDKSKRYKKRTVTVTHIMANSFLWALSQVNRMDLAQELWKEFTELGLVPNLQMWTTLIDGYGRNDQLATAEATWSAMLETGVEPDNYAYGAMIYAYFAKHKHNEAYAMFCQHQANLKASPAGRRKMREPEMLALYNIVIHGLCTHHKEKVAHEIMEDISQNGPKPDIVTYNTFLRFYGRIGDTQNLAAVIRSLEPAGLKPDAHSFTTLLSALYKRGMDDAHTKMINTMKSVGITPNVTIYTAIINNLVRLPGEENLRNARLLLEQMENSRDASSRPNNVTYTCLLSGILRNPSVESNTASLYVEELLGRMKRNGVEPNRITYHYLIKSSLENPKAYGLQMALNLYEEMQKRGFLITNRTWFVILSGLYRRGDWEVAKEILMDMKRKNVVFDPPLISLEQRIEDHTDRTPGQFLML
ncbi:hypothetical protein M422DRAFT_192600 [Sphaerobolus stellatus SS14]|uniref:Unplaced genomic scaffold SPHSTscaffold_307, whole genome shotgun sequence n=1 Tax=Sphaerobolus stellatus (strain SS14) TaxID=990650 RepID=A0A0C9UAL5_SPHS4|nr:hypothetical protein M422DRAFT_192600 [Sphaerobolus stellatus SS14]